MSIFLNYERNDFSIFDFNILKKDYRGLFFKIKNNARYCIFFVFYYLQLIVTAFILINYN